MREDSHFSEASGRWKLNSKLLKRRGRVIDSPQKPPLQTPRLAEVASGGGSHGYAYAHEADGDFGWAI